MSVVTETTKIEVVETPGPDITITVGPGIGGASEPQVIETTSPPDTVVTETTKIETVDIARTGPQGASVQGDPGDPGPQNLFVQDTNPMQVEPGLWVQTNIGGNTDAMTFWVAVEV